MFCSKLDAHIHLVAVVYFLQHFSFTVVQHISSTSHCITICQEVVYTHTLCKEWRRFPAFFAFTTLHEMAAAAAALKERLTRVSRFIILNSFQLSHIYWSAYLYNSLKPSKIVLVQPITCQIYLATMNFTALNKHQSYWTHKVQFGRN